MTNKMNLNIEGINYIGVPVEVARAIEAMVNPYREVKAETPKETPKTKEQPKAKKTYAKAYTVTEDGKGIVIGNGGFVPKKVFNAIKFSLKDSGAKWNADTKSWVFDTKTKCKAWTKNQDARA